MNHAGQQVIAGDRLSLAYAVGVGAPRSADEYPAIFVAGILDGVGGVFRSDDQGQTWTEITDPDHHYGQLIVIQGDPRVYGRIYLGTNGRGIVVGDLRSTTAPAE